MDEPRPGVGDDEDEASRPDARAPDDPTAPIPTLPDPRAGPATAASDDLTQPVDPVTPPPALAAPAVPAPAVAAASATGTGVTLVSDRPAVSRRRRIGATVGIVVCAILIVVAVLGRFYAVGKVEELAGRVDDGLERGVTLIDTASGRIQPVVDAAGTVADAADAAAASPTGPIANIAGLLGDVTGLGERYRQFRTTYSEARETILAAFARLHAIDTLIPQITIPSGPEDAFLALDARIQTLDQTFADLAAATPLGDVSNEAATKIAEKARNVESAIGGIVDALHGAEARLQEARADVQSLAGTLNLVITLILLVFILGFLYIAFLNWLLLHP
jgi:hypothetical protein